MGFYFGFFKVCYIYYENIWLLYEYIVEILKILVILYFKCYYKLIVIGKKFK